LFSVPIYKTICRWKTLQLLTKHVLRVSFYHLSYIQVIWPAESYWQALSHNVISAGIKVKDVTVIGGCWLKDNTTKPIWLYTAENERTSKDMFEYSLDPDIYIVQTHNNTKEKTWKHGIEIRCSVCVIFQSTAAYHCYIFDFDSRRYDVMW
jgi:hypothetical protein